MDHTDLTVIMLTRNRADLLPMSLAHLEQQSHPSARYELLVVDLDSNDATEDVLSHYAQGAPVRTRHLRTTASPAMARNEAIEQARGRFVLFIDDDLFAGPRLVESHLRTQENRGGCAGIGHVTHHPQVDPKTFVRTVDFETERSYVRGQPLRFIDWRACNLCLPREAVDAAGGFDPDFSVPGLEDVELAWRLEQQDLRGFFSTGASSYAWRPTTLEAEEKRYYLEGFSLRQLIRKTESEIVQNRYEKLMKGLPFHSRRLMPVYRRLAPFIANNTPLFTRMCKRILAQAFHRGYRDACAGHQPAVLP